MIESTQQKELEKALKGIKEAVKKAITLQESFHKALVPCVIYAWQYKDTSIIIKAMDQLSDVKGFARMQSIAYYLNEVCGFNLTYSTDKDTWSCAFAKEKKVSAFGIRFTYDAAHLALAQEEKYRFFKIAPKEEIELKLPTKLENATQSAEIQLARALAAGTFTSEQIAAHLAGELQRIMDLANSGKTKEWLGKYYLQHPELSPAPAETEVQLLQI